jgi:tRNA-2-methylthio-N6-dimethylallyladenosine synthase
MYYHLLTLGCQMNVSDSERMHTIIQGMGYVYTDNEEEANLLGILACSVRQKAIDKVYSRIRRWNTWKNERNLVTFVSGCVLPADREKFLRLFDFVFPMSEAHQLPEMVREYGINTERSLRFMDSRMPENTNIFSIWNITPTYRSSFDAFIPIQNGCDKFCTFCAVPYTRGREISRPSAEILSEAEKLVRSGYKNITLLGQNVNSYGLDRKGEELDFRELLEAIGELGVHSGRDFLVYFTSPHPRDMSQDVIDTIAKYPVLAKMIHLPLQSGDDKILVKMNRGYNLEQYGGIVRYIRKKLPGATLFTDIIVGFTGETEEQFNNTVKALEMFRFNMAYIARYSARPGAASYRWEDNVTHEQKKSRLEKLSGILSEISSGLNREMTGKTYKVLVTGKDRKPGYLTGHTEGRIIVRFPSTQVSMIGTFTRVRILSSSDFSVEGEMIMSDKEILKPVY